MLEYTKIEPPMEINAAYDNILYGTVQDISLVLERCMDDVCRKVKIPAILVLGLKRNILKVHRQLNKVSKE